MVLVLYSCEEYLEIKIILTQGRKFFCTKSSLNSFFKEKVSFFSSGAHLLTRTFNITVSSICLKIKDYLGVFSKTEVSCFTFIIQVFLEINYLQGQINALTCQHFLMFTIIYWVIIMC